MSTKSSKPKQINVQLSEWRDIPLLCFLWKHKVATTAALTARFFPNAKSATAYNKLRRLSRAGLIRMRADGFDQKYVWMLTELGYQKVVKPILPVHESALQSDGYEPESVSHDLLSSAVLLGDWLTGEPEGVEIYTDQQLRRFHPDVYDDWVPKCNRRPDGYWRILVNGKARIVALEVELGRKRPSELEMTAYHYSKVESLTRVLWLVPTPARAKSIQKALTKGRGEGRDIHNFVSYRQFKEHGWQSKIELGPESGRTLRYLLNAEQENAPSHVMGQLLLNLQKCPHHSKGLALLEIGDFAQSTRVYNPRQPLQDGDAY